MIDYGAGNLHSVHNALKAAGADAVEVTADLAVLRRCERIVLPGVGSFRSCAEGLRNCTGLIAALEDRVLGERVPFLGICVGMQLLATRGYEHGETPGLDWIGGDVLPVERTDEAIKVPHMGWNDVALLPHARQHPVLREGEAYFLHSYHFVADDGQDVAAMTDHGGGIVAAVSRDNIAGVQFHPEKSQRYGIAMLRRFLDWQPA
nr:imidazole glycerol phosphate synthase subunit HisH [Pseudopontixanthobacter vadosimaris]